MSHHVEAASIENEKGVMSHFEKSLATDGEDDFQINDSAEEKRLTKSILRKLDTRMLPMLAVLFLFSFLDRTNIGNAKILGLQKDLKLTNSQYSNCLAIFFAFYIASEGVYIWHNVVTSPDWTASPTVPSNLIIKKVSPRVWLGALTMAWGVIGMAMGFVKSYAGMMAVRSVCLVLASQKV